MMLLLLLSLLGNAPVPGQRRRGGSATSWRLRPVHSLLYLCTGSSLRLEHCTPHLPALSTVLWVMSAVKIGKSGARELYFQRGPSATRAAPIRCWCEWIFDAVFACNKQLSSVILHRSCSVPPIPFLCIFANLEVQERYDTRCYFNVRSKADTSHLNLQRFPRPTSWNAIANNQRCMNAVSLRPKAL